MGSSERRCMHLISGLPRCLLPSPASSSPHFPADADRHRQQHSRHSRCSLPTLIMKVNKFRHSKPPTGRIGQIFHNIRPGRQRNSRHSFQHQTKFQVYFRWRPYATAATAKHKSHQDRPTSDKKRKREKRNTMQIQQKKATHLHLSTYTLQSQTLR